MDGVGDLKSGSSCGKEKRVNKVMIQYKLTKQCNLIPAVVLFFLLLFLFPDTWVVVVVSDRSVVKNRLQSVERPSVPELLISVQR